MTQKKAEEAENYWVSCNKSLTKKISHANRQHSLNNVTEKFMFKMATTIDANKTARANSAAAAAAACHELVHCLES